MTGADLRRGHEVAASSRRDRRGRARRLSEFAPPDPPAFAVPRDRLMTILDLGVGHHLTVVQGRTLIRRLLTIMQADRHLDLRAA